jgi:large subunit ribosomal protein L18
MDKKVIRRQKIHYRIRNRVSGTAEKPRLSVFRSNRDIYAQLIDDDKGQTLVSASSREKGFKVAAGSKVDQSKQVGQELAKKAQALGITRCVFDRSGYLYHGRVKSLSEGAREGGLQF